MDLRSILWAWADDAAAFATVLAEIDPMWGSEQHAVGGGRLVLSGHGLYVNRLLAAGIDRSLTDEDIDVVIDRSAAVGVPPSIEVSELTAPASIDALRARGFVPGPSATTGMVWPADTDPPIAPDDIVVEPARDVVRWQRLTAAGWEIGDGEPRRASDAFVRAATVIDGDGMVVAVDATTGRDLGAASLTMRTPIATLGGMSTLPADRRRGVQRALVTHRIALARRRGASAITTSATAGGDSERNLVRLGFRPVVSITNWTLPEAPAGTPWPVRTEGARHHPYLPGR